MGPITQQNLTGYKGLHHYRLSFSSGHISAARLSNCSAVDQLLPASSAKTFARSLVASALAAWAPAGAGGHLSLAREA